MQDSLEKKFTDAVWTAHSLFDRGKTSGSSANMSFLHEGRIYITASGSCFGTLSADDFVAVDEQNRDCGEKKPSKEYVLHKYFYEKDPAVRAVIHTHGFYSVLWSCRHFEQDEDIIPAYTPYLRMKVGRIGLVPYAKPGSEELFEAFRNSLSKGDAYLLKNHGGIVGGKTILDAFYQIEELEESAKIACMIEKGGSYEKIY